MLGKSKTITASGRSTVTVEERDVIAMTMNANINEDGSISINKYIQNKEIYFENQATVDADYAEFETYVKGLAEV